MDRAYAVHPELKLACLCPPIGTRDLNAGSALASSQMEIRMATVDAIKTRHTSMIDTRRAYEKAAVAWR